MKLVDIRIRLVGFLLLAFVSLPSQAGSLVLKGDQWHMITVPTSTVAPTIRDFVEGELPTDEYQTSWAAFFFEEGHYRTPELVELLVPGTSFWLMHTEPEPITLRLDTDGRYLQPVRSNACVSNLGCVEIELPAVDEVRWHLVGEPFGQDLSLADLRVVTRAANSPCFNGCNLNEANEHNIVFNRFYSWSNIEGSYQALSAADELEAYEGAWLATYPLHVEMEVYLLVPLASRSSSNIYISTNAGTPELGTIVTPGGTNIMIGGAKDVDGFPIKPDQLTSENKAGQMKVTKYDPLGRPELVTDPNAGTLTLDYDSEGGRVDITWTSADGESQGKGIVEDPTILPMGAVDSPQLQTTAKINLRCGVESGMPGSFVPNAQLSLIRRYPSPGPGLAPIPVSIPTTEISQGVHEYRIPRLGVRQSLIDTEPKFLQALDVICGADETSGLDLTNLIQFEKKAINSLLESILDPSLKKQAKRAIRNLTPWGRGACLANHAYNGIQVLDDFDAVERASLFATAVASAPYAGSDSANWEIAADDVFVPDQNLVLDDAASCPGFVDPRGFLRARITTACYEGNARDIAVSYPVNGMPFVTTPKLRTSCISNSADLGSSTAKARANYTRLPHGYLLEIDGEAAHDGSGPLSSNSLVDFFHGFAVHFELDPQLYSPGQIIDIPIEVTPDLNAFAFDNGTPNSTEAYIAAGRVTAGLIPQNTFEQHQATEKVTINLPIQLNNDGDWWVVRQQVLTSYQFLGHRVSGTPPYGLYSSGVNGSMSVLFSKNEGVQCVKVSESIDLDYMGC